MTKMHVTIYTDGACDGNPVGVDMALSFWKGDPGGNCLEDFD